ncbi:serine hydrolase family protein [Microbispora sp. RL4-1S]|uniref:Serine hydrolase family protein n=1 Tax=Microbispora oryzae TaxID=2806554 RepID=A0A940WJU9_9ACTN|nr:alpha/beta hydrolase [Microbispora oryzae]MBP2706970.1 serine hydrolase family protein [Microbispora oryzae]
MDFTHGPTATLVYLAGIGNSGPGHWQARWHARVPGGVWVEHSSWDDPVRDVWVRDLDEALRAVEGPKILVAHSLGCALVPQWVAEHADECEDAGVAGALLVALPDPGGPEFPSQAVGFDAPKYQRLPFPAVVVASEDDPYGSLGHATEVAGIMGADLVNVGRKGHINADSGLGDWPEGWALLTGAFTG